MATSGSGVFGRSGLGLLVAFSLSAAASGQVSGSRGGTLAGDVGARPRLSPEDAGAFIAIEGSCELRVAADLLRVVFAVSSEGATPADCWAAQKQQRQAFLDVLPAGGVAPTDVQVDFIGVLPVYDWKQETREGKSVLVEKLVAYRLQENVHVAVPDEEAARRVIELGLSKGVHDVITVEYSTKDASAKRREAMQTALATAKAKADVLLAAFEKRPPLANVTEETRVLEPSRLYQSFENSYDSAVEQNWREEIPRVHAFRPKNTFFAGYEGQVDTAATTPRMKPEISVVSTVVLYFESPAHARPKDAAPAGAPERR